MARETHQPLLIFNSALSWLRGHTRGAVIVDWATAGRELDGVAEILCHPSIASRLHAATRRCWPRPIIAIPGKNMGHAA